MNEEEKNIVKKLGYCEQEYEQNGYLSVGKFEAIKQAIQLIEKQQKEIERLKEYEYMYKDLCKQKRRINETKHKKRRIQQSNNKQWNKL